MSSGFVIQACWKAMNNFQVQSLQGNYSRIITVQPSQYSRIINIKNNFFFFSYFFQSLNP